MTEHETTRGRPARMSVATLATLVALVGGGTYALAARPAVGCGSVVVEDVKLQGDLGPCAGDGLRVAASGITVDLNGYKILGTKRLGIGIRVENVATVVVKGGIVEGFDAGVLLIGGNSHRVTQVQAQNNRFGIRVEDAESSGHQIDRNVASGNRLIGIFLGRSVSQALIRDNDTSANVGYGIVLGAGSGLNRVERNVARGNRVRDIELREYETSLWLLDVVPPVFKPVAPDRPPYLEGVDFHVGSGSEEGIAPELFNASARLVPVGIVLDPAATGADNPMPADTSSSGCTAEEYVAAGFRRGDIALVQRGTCEIAVKVEQARRAGALGVVLFNEGQAPSRTTHDFGISDLELSPFPVLFASYGVGFELAADARRGPVSVSLRVQTAGARAPWLGPTYLNLVSRNVADSAADENRNCNTNRWTKNRFGSWNRPCVIGDTTDEGGGGGGTGSRARIY